jgi:prevent-host-death family protein
VAIVNTHQAKTHFSKLIDRALAGEEILIARAGKPPVRLQPVEAARQPVLGTGKGTVTFHEGWDAPMTEEELADWYGPD